MANVSGCGTVAGYSRHVRRGEPTCDACRDAWRDYHTVRRSDSAKSGGIPPVRCQHCREEVEACDGVYGIWMHTHTRRELGDDGHLAEGEAA